VQNWLPTAATILAVASHLSEGTSGGLPDQKAWPPFPHSAVQSFQLDGTKLLAPASHPHRSMIYRTIKHKRAEIGKYVLGDSIRQMPDRQHVRLLLATSQ
jgi:hypothetical protein